MHVHTMYVHVHVCGDLAAVGSSYTGNRVSFKIFLFSYICVFGAIDSRGLIVFLIMAFASVQSVMPGAPRPVIAIALLMTLIFSYHESLLLKYIGLAL